MTHMKWQKVSQGECAGKYAACTEHWCSNERSSRHWNEPACAWWWKKGIVKNGDGRLPVAQRRAVNGQEMDGSQLLHAPAVARERCLTKQSLDRLLHKKWKVVTRKPPVLGRKGRYASPTCKLNMRGLMPSQPSQRPGCVRPSHNKWRQKAWIDLRRP